MIDKKQIEKDVLSIIEAIGENIDREGLLKTPERVADFYEDIFSGLHLDPKEALETFKCEKHEELVLVKNLSFYSMCEHHFLPFFGKAHIAYIPKNNIVTGFSKLAKITDILSRRPQLQERLTTQIADVIMEKLNPLGVIVVIEAEHLCMTMRDRSTQGSTAITSAVRGLFLKNEATRAEVMALISK